MKIRFLETYKVKDSEGRKFLKDEVYDLPDPSALHFIRRGRAAVFVPEPAKIVEPAPEPETIQPLPVSGTKPQRKSWNRSKK
jgi:hypothetical protein